MTDRELADLRQLAKDSMDPYKDVLVCPGVLLELVRGYEWGNYIQAKYQPETNKFIDDTLKRLAYPPVARRKRALAKPVEEFTRGTIAAENRAAGSKEKGKQQEVGG